ncbi:MAG TPA: GTP-binding protein, partial [Polyangiaceae bacterium]
MSHATVDIRNVALVGDQGVGKTLLAEAMLFASGAVRQKGSLARGTTVCDFDTLEKRLLHSLDVSCCHFETGPTTVNLVDTPGYADFTGRTLAALEATETAAVVVSAVDGVGPMARKLMELARERELCRLVVVNKIDRKEARAAEVLAEIREAFGKECLPLNLPAATNGAVIDCFFSPSDAPTATSSVALAHKEMVEQVVEVDETLMAQYLEQGESLSPEQLHDPFETALRQGHLIPVCFVSAETGAGIDLLVRAIA